ncbi:MAG: hypothetical protein M3P82_03645 [Bacteroidota bacterium]|nr:hypothetical protein [Bacteroidota bacterium]
MMVIKKFIVVFCIFIFAPLIYSQQQDPNYKTYTAKLGYSDTLVNIGEKFVIQFSDILTLQNIVLKPLSDYDFNYREGIITLNKNLFEKYALDTFQIYNLKIDYDVFPYNLKDEYSNFEILIERDSITGDTVQIATQRKDFIGSIFEGTELEKSGSLFRGVNIGSNRDLSLNSGFRLQLNGKLTNDIEINAALTDESTPIQPEGNTAKLQELDKVFIEIKSNNVTGTIGDINVDFDKTEFVNFKRKIQGAKGYSDYGFGNIFLSGAVQRGKFNTNSFNGIDRVQGPYVLVGKDNEINILVLSGTEKVYLDGNLMIRGEQADYVIDYGIGTVTFTNNRLITSASRIIVDFEYSDRKYNRTIIAGANQIRFFKNKLSLITSYVNQNDNQDKTIDFTLSEQDRQILADAGDDKFKAIKSGVIFAGRDSSGKGLGLYAKVDTIIGIRNVTYYKYLPNDSNAIYQITFTFVGQGKGNYVQQSQLQYNFAGLNQGNFDTIIFIPLPSAYQVADVKLNYQSSPAREFTFDLESAVSTLDANKFSTFSDENNRGVALYGTLGVNKYNFRLLGMKLKTFELTLREKLVNKVFEPLERVNPVEFYREYDIQDTNRLTENLHEASLRIAPSNYVDLKATFGQLLRGDEFNSLRTVADITLRDDSLNLPNLKYKIELINSDYSIFNLKSRWIRQFASLGYRKFLSEKSFDSPNLELRFDFNQENRKNNTVGIIGDSLQSGSFSFFELRPRLVLNNFFNFNLYGEFGYRDDNVPLNGVMMDQANSYTQTYGVRYSGINWLSTLFEMTFRNKKFTDTFVSEANTNDNTLLVNWQTRIDPFSSALQTDFFYNISSERQAKIEKVFVEVRVGEGNYVYLGDLDSNGFRDENEFQLTNFNDGNFIRINRPTSQLFPVTALNTSVRFNFKPERFFQVKGGSFFSEVLRNTSTETYFRTEEKSKDPNTDNIYFLHFSSFQNDSNTLIGTQLFQQDINFFEFNPSYSLKFRYIEQKTFNQFVSGNERLLGIQKSAKLKLGLTKDFTTLFEYLNILDRNSAPVTSVRNRNIKSDGVLTDFSYRPVQQIESGFQINFIRAIDRYPFTPTQADINQQILRFVYSFTFLGRLRLEIERDEVRLSNSAITFPYELTNGRQEGKSFLWRGFFDYSISKNLQATFNYDGRSEGGGRVIHSGRAEVKAFF